MIDMRNQGDQRNGFSGQALVGAASAAMLPVSARIAAEAAPKMVGMHRVNVATGATAS